MNVLYRAPDNFVYVRVKGRNFKFSTSTSRSGIMKAYLGGLNGWTVVYSDMPDPAECYALLASRVRQVLETAWKDGKLR
jgi:hypothetical protein